MEVPRAKLRARVEPIHDLVLETTGARTAGNPPLVTHQEHSDQKAPSKVCSISFIVCWLVGWLV